MIHHERIERIDADEGDEESAYDVIEFDPGVFSVWQASRHISEFDTLADAIAFAEQEACYDSATGPYCPIPREDGDEGPVLMMK